LSSLPLKSHPRKNPNNPALIMVSVVSDPFCDCVVDVDIVCIGSVFVSVFVVVFCNGCRFLDAFLLASSTGIFATIKAKIPITINPIIITVSNISLTSY
jgi:hypothetical protein